MNQLKIPIDTLFHGQTILDFLRYFQVAKPKIYLLEQHKNLLVNHTFFPFSQLLNTGDEIEIDLDEFENIDFIPEKADLDVLYEDDDLLVLNKPSGIIIHPADKLGVGTLVNRIAYYYTQKGINRQIRYLHRLDFETTGCLLVAKHFLMHSYLAAHWDHLSIKRQYLALVAGILHNPKGVISQPIGKDRHVNNKFRISETGEAAVTHYEVVKTYDNYSLVRLILGTGRTHQIRVHMASIGHPLLGDVLYGGRTDKIKRVALHSESIELTNPLSGHPLLVVAQLPKDMLRLT